MILSFPSLVISPSVGEITVRKPLKSQKLLNPLNQWLNRLHINTECKKDISGHIGSGNFAGVFGLMELINYLGIRNAGVVIWRMLLFVKCQIHSLHNFNEAWLIAIRLQVTKDCYIGHIWIPSDISPFSPIQSFIRITCQSIQHGKCLC